MRLLFMIILAIPCLVSAQPKNKYAKDAYMILHMASKFHVQPKTFDETFALSFFDRFLEAIDESKIIFNQSDLESLAPYKKTIYKELQEQRANFLYATIAIVDKRIQQIDSLLGKQLTTAFKFDATELFANSENANWSLNADLQWLKITKKIKQAVLQDIVESELIDVKQPLSAQKKLIDSLEQIARRKTITQIRQSLIQLKQGAIGLTESLGNLYCATLAASFDPHTMYMPKTLKENFESSLGQEARKFGFNLSKKPNEAGIEIEHLKPGSAAYKSGQLNEGDKIISLQWDGKASIDVSDEGLAQVSQILDQSNHDKINITVKKKDGSIKQVALYKEPISTEDEGKVKGWLINGEQKNIGYLSIPSFYTDWNNLIQNVNGCANDVAKEIIELKKEPIEGLIIDLRYNGGGSLKEAVELAGLFIDAGPVSMMQKKNEKIITIKDVNRGTIYDGPLVILVNGSSASASELFAAAMQDYRRAVIVGSPTFGKATGQVIYALDTTFLGQPVKDNSQADSYLKLTIEQLFRINGQSLQAQGLIPDIQIPNDELIDSEKEANQPMALQSNSIEANKYYTPYNFERILPMIERGKALIDTHPAFHQVLALKKVYDSLSKISSETLVLKKALDEQNGIEQLLNKITNAPKKTITSLSIRRTKAEIEKIKLNPFYAEVSKQWNQVIENDIWIQSAVHLFKLNQLQ